MLYAALIETLLSSIRPFGLSFVFEIWSDEEIEHRPVEEELPFVVKG